VDARVELDAYQRGDEAALGRALQLLDAIEQEFETARTIVRSLTSEDEDEPWTRL
jgi:hypothetical protein